MRLAFVFFFFKLDFLVKQRRSNWTKLSCLWVDLKSIRVWEPCITQVKAGQINERRLFFLFSLIQDGVRQSTSDPGSRSRTGRLNRTHYCSCLALCITHYSSVWNLRPLVDARWIVSVVATAPSIRVSVVQCLRKELLSKNRAKHDWTDSAVYYFFLICRFRDTLFILIVTGSAGCRHLWDKKHR